MCLTAYHFQTPETSIVRKIYKWKPSASRQWEGPSAMGDDVRNDLRKMKLVKWTEQVQDRLEWKNIVEKAKNLPAEEEEEEKEEEEKEEEEEEEKKKKQKKKKKKKKK